MLQFRVEGGEITIETDHYAATVATEGYVSGVRAGSLIDRKTGARELGFGVSIVDFLLEPAKIEQMGQPGQYEIAPRVMSHGRILKRYVEGPQICTQAKKLPFEIVRGSNFLAVRLWYRFDKEYPPHKVGSRWEQTLVFPENSRWFFSADRVTSINDHPALVLRIDMPGHIKHDRGDTFEQVYLSYAGTIPASAFAEDFAPDEKHLYQRQIGRLPEHMIRAYQTRVGGQAGPWLAGITLAPGDVHEAWCHQRGYVCMIEEIGARPIRAGETFGACYCLGWFDHIEAMVAAAETYKGWSGMALDGPADRPTAFHGVAQKDLSAVRPIDRNPA